MLALIRTLVADDNLLFCTSLVDYLNGLPEFQVVDVAYDGRQTLDKLKEYQPDLLLLDVVMPHLDGVEVLNKIKLISPSTHTVIISSLPEKSLRSYISGNKEVLAMMSKPLDFNQLLERIQQVPALESRLSNSPMTLSSDLSPSQKAINLLLYSIGISDEEKGFQYLRDALEFTLEDSSLVYDLTGQLYPRLAQAHSVSSKTVERSIRRSVFQVWNYGSQKKLEKIFGLSPKDYRNCPSNGNFIATLLRQLIIEN